MQCLQARFHLKSFQKPAHVILLSNCVKFKKVITTKLKIFFVKLLSLYQHILLNGSISNSFSSLIRFWKKILSSLIKSQKQISCESRYCLSCHLVRNNEPSHFHLVTFWWFEIVRVVLKTRFPGDWWKSPMCSVKQVLNAIKCHQREFNASFCLNFIAIT